MRRLELVFLFLGLPRSKLILWTFYDRDFVFFYILVLVAGYSIGFFEGRAILDSETLTFGIRLAVIVISLDIERDKKENMATSLFFFFFFFPRCMAPLCGNAHLHFYIFILHYTVVTK